jgi:thioredoxin-like negative regulator of GroEL
MLFFMNGKVVRTQVGALPEQMLRRVIDQFLSSIAVAN